MTTTELWDERLRAVPTEQRIGAYAAAAVGDDIRGVVLKPLLSALGLDPHETLLSLTRAQILIASGADRFRWPHALLQEHLASRVSDRADAPVIYRLAANALEAHPTVGSRRIMKLRVNNLLRAGDDELAASLMLKFTAESWNRSRDARAVLKDLDVIAAADRVVGYYNLLTNRVTTFDLTGSDQLARRPATSAGRAGLEILASPEAAGLVSTLVHEASHQMAFNCRMHRRLAPVPVWLSEGVATFFETPDPGGRGWKRIGGVNRPRLDSFLTSYRPGVLDEIVRGDEPFRATEGAIDAYARAWALTAFLAQTRKAALVDYITAIGAKPPLAPDGPEERLEDFVAAFGVDLGAGAATGSAATTLAGPAALPRAVR
jgi:hypothetical protein